jgi:hypothetical protein
VEVLTTENTGERKRKLLFAFVAGTLWHPCESSVLFIALEAMFRKICREAYFFAAAFPRMTN